MEALSQSFRALGDPTRLRILRLVAQAPLNVSELVSLVGVAQSSVSHHLGKLRGLGLVREERQAGFSYYSLALDEADARWPLVRLAQEAADAEGDAARLEELLRQRSEAQALGSPSERLVEPGQSWFLWAGALSSLLPPLDVVDFGCGGGALAASMATWARRVWAVDQSAEALARAKALCAARGLTNVTFLREDLTRLSLPDGKRGLVVISQSLHYVEDPEAVLREAARILEPGGRVVVLELMPHDERWVLERLGHRHLGFAPEHLESLLKSAGFGALAREDHAREPHRPFRVYRLTGVRKQR